MKTDKRQLGKDLEALLFVELSEAHPESDVFVAVHVHSMTSMTIETLIKHATRKATQFVRHEYHDSESQEWLAAVMIRQIRERREGGAS